MAKQTGRVSTLQVERLSQYRRLLRRLRQASVRFVVSRELAAMAGVTAAQVRRDLMVIGHAGNPARGYEVSRLADAIGRFLDDPDGVRMALVGVGNMGRAILAYFAGRRPRLTFVAAFDKDPDKVHRVISGCRCYAMSELGRVIGEQKVLAAVIAVPAAEAQAVADELVAQGVRGLLNFAPVTLVVPPHVFQESLDITISLEKVAYFARHDEAGGRRRGDRDPPSAAPAPVARPVSAPFLE